MIFSEFKPLHQLKYIFKNYIQKLVTAAEIVQSQLTILSKSV